MIVGIFLWDFTHQSGIHATIAGVLLALTIPHNIKNNKQSFVKIRTWFISLCCIWNYANFCICKCWCFFRRFNFATLLNPVPLGIVLGLFFGKQIGVFVLSYISVKLKFADNPKIQLGQLFMLFLY